jgi:hypothetical protein
MVWGKFADRELVPGGDWHVSLQRSLTKLSQGGVERK